MTTEQLVEPEKRYRPPTSSQWLVKVPAVTTLFWLVKVLTTGMGEAAADFLGRQNLFLPAAIGIIGLGTALTLQFRATSYRAVTYWSTVSMLAIFGTVAADGLRSALGLSLSLITLGYGVALGAVLLTWRMTEGTLSIHSIDTRRREAFYWVTVLLTFALGTAAGDLTAFQWNLGFLNSALAFAAAMLVLLMAHRARLINAVVAFWSAYVLTRPLGASLADWLGKGSPLGVGLGDGTVTLAALVLITGLVGYLAVTRVDVQEETAPPAALHQS